MLTRQFSHFRPTVEVDHGILGWAHQALGMFLLSFSIQIGHLMRSYAFPSSFFTQD